MSMYRPYDNVSFNNCYDFIIKTKTEKANWEIFLTRVFDDPEEMNWELDHISDLTEKIISAEYDLCEMEMNTLSDVAEYDSLMNGNAFRSSKRANRRKQNKKHHKADRKHGKPVPQSDKKWWDEQSNTFYRWDEKKKTFHSYKKPVVHRNRKTFRDRLNSAMAEREKDLLAFDDLYDKSELVVKQARKETDPIRKTQLWDLDKNLTDAMCVDFYDGWYPDLSVKPERF